MKKSQIPADIFILEQLIRKGQIRRAQQLVREIASRNIPHALARKVAAYARRVNLPETGLKCLFPYVRPTGKKIAERDDADLAEYAANLVRAGAPREAESLLKRLNPNRHPQASLFRAFARIAEWQYPEAGDHLRQYLRTPDLGDYERLVAESNLASCLVYEGDLKGAHPLLDRLLHATKDEGHLLLHGNLWKLKAQATLNDQDFKEARNALQQAERTLLRAETLDKIILEKWTTFIELREHGANPRVLSRLAKVRERAVKENHWETIRDCDRELLAAKPSAALYHKLYFGTPFKSFREDLRTRWGSRFALPEGYDWYPGKAAKQSPIVSLMSKLPQAIHPGDSSHRLLLTLCSDFYRPFRTASLFSQIFPDEYFNPDTSAVRVRMTVKRLRDAFKKSKIGILIATGHGEYRLDPKNTVGIRVGHPLEEVDREALRFERLKAAVGAEELTVKEITRRLKSSRRSAQRLLESAVKADQVIRLGDGRTTRYKRK